jgi:hypothetical protein
MKLASFASMLRPLHLLIPRSKRLDGKQLDQPVADTSPASGYGYPIPHVPTLPNVTPGPADSFR